MNPNNNTFRKYLALFFSTEKVEDALFHILNGENYSFAFSLL